MQSDEEVSELEHLRKVHRSPTDAPLESQLEAVAALAKHGEQEKEEIVVPQVHKDVTETVQVTEQQKFETPATQIVQPKIEDSQPSEPTRPAAKVNSNSINISISHFVNTVNRP